MKKSLAVLFLALLGPATLFSQVRTNAVELEQIAKEKTQEWKQAVKRVDKYVKEHQVERRQELENGGTIEMVDVVDGRPVYYVTDNADAAVTTRANELWPGGSLGLNITGVNFNDKVAVWDGGSARVTHQEFNNTGTPRAIKKDGGSNNNHATHVAGTIIAGGVDPSAKGMAYEGTLYSYDWSNDEGEMASAAAGGLLISNHSYGLITGWYYDNGWIWYGEASISPNEDYNFGYYSSQAQDWDRISRNAPYYLIVKSAGNDRGDGPSNAGSPGVPEQDGGEDGYDCISHAGNAKNILTVGAVEKVANYTKPEDVKMSYFSGWGPADDGRIKPDVVAAGVNLYSSVATGDARYDIYSGTSMATPNTTGTLSLLHEYYQSLYDEDMLSSTLKGLVIHTADECGAAEGPDYEHGWGLVNAKRAAEVIQQHESLLTINEITLIDGEEYQREVASSGNEPLRITVCWTDPEGPVHAPALNNRASVLINDLDLKLVDQQGNVFYPYKLDPDNPANPATKDSPNDVDNVEHIYIGDPQGGTYTIVVGHKGNLEGGEQVFSLIVSGIGEYDAPPLCTTLKSPENGSSNALVNQEIVWKKADFASYYEIYFGTDGNGVELPTNIYNGDSLAVNSFQHNMEPGMTYYLAIHPANNYGVNTACNTVFSFTTLTIEDEDLPYSLDFDDLTPPNLPEGWQSIDNSLRVWRISDEESLSGRNALVCMVDFGQIEPMDNLLITPPIAIETEKDYELKFQYRVYQHINESVRVVWGTYPTLEEMTNEIFVSDEVYNTEWEEMVIPLPAATAKGAAEADGYIFLGIHLNSPQGSGLLIDDLILEETVIINIDETEADRINVRYDNGFIFFSGADFEKTEVSVFNLLGQEMLTGRSIDGGKVRFEALPGVYVVRLNGVNGTNLSKKIIVR